MTTFHVFWDFKATYAVYVLDTAISEVLFQISLCSFKETGHMHLYVILQTSKETPEQMFRVLITCFSEVPIPSCYILKSRWIDLIVTLYP